MSALISSLGSIDEARKVFDKMRESSSAYQKLLQDALGGELEGHSMAWEEIPLVTKKNFYSQHSWREIVPRASYRDIYSIIRSSGSSTNDGKSRGFFWPQLKSRDSEAGPVVQAMLRQAFHLDSRSTLAIIGLSLGSWAGGEQFSFIFKALALQSKHPLVVFSPGNQHGEILELIEQCAAEFDQLIIALCPSAIFYLERLAEKSGVKLPLEKVSFLCTGEPFAEELRLDLQNRFEKKASDLVLLSVYGSADTGVIGVESSALVAMRQALIKMPEAAKEAGFNTRAVPNLYHLSPGPRYLETVNDELVISQWQGLPLVRYNLEDKVQFFSWRRLCEIMASHDKNSQTPWALLATQDLPDVISVSGRSKGCLFLCGSNVFEPMLQEALMHSSVWERSTGAFVAWTEIQQGQQVLNWQIELKPGQSAPLARELDRLHGELVETLSAQQPEFGEDYEKFYKPFESQGLRIFRFRFCEGPALSEHPSYNTGIKRKIIIEQGPIE